MKTIDAPVGWNFRNNTEMPTPIGRIHIGEHVGRWYYHVSEGKTILVISRDALEDGSIIISGYSQFTSGLGVFTKDHKKAAERRSGNERRKEESP
jgi:hypothetical protein